MKGFQFYLSTVVDFGCGKIKNLSSYIKQYNAKSIVIVTDKNLQQIGLLQPIIEKIKECNVKYSIFNKVEPNPEIHIINEGAVLAKQECADMVITVGGGSSIDTGKGISIMGINEGSIYDYLDGRGENKREIKNHPIPLIAIPTTSGTGSEVSMYSVITDENTRIKDSITSPLIYPKVAIVDPEMTFKLPPTVTAHTGLDVLGHALESYTSLIENSLTNVWALEAIKLVFDNLPDAVNKGTKKARENMAFASVMAGSAMSHCGATIPHGLGCPLSGHCNLPHGLTVGILQIPMIEYNKEALKDRFLSVVKYVNGKTEICEEQAADELIAMIKKLFIDVNVSETLDRKLINKETIKSMVRDAGIHGCTGLNPVPLNDKDIEAIYNKVIQ